MKKRILYIDMDGVIADFDSAIQRHAPLFKTDPTIDQAIVDSICEENPRIFYGLDPLPDAIDSVKHLMDHYEVYFLSTPMWTVPNSFTDKRLWIEHYFGDKGTKRLILTHRKDLCIGDILVDDRLKNGSENFKGIHIHFGQPMFPNWEIVYEHLMRLHYHWKDEEKRKIEGRNFVLHATKHIAKHMESQNAENVPGAPNVYSSMEPDTIETLPNEGNIAIGTDVMTHNTTVINNTTLGHSALNNDKLDPWGNGNSKQVPGTY